MNSAELIRELQKTGIRLLLAADGHLVAQTDAGTDSVMPSTLRLIEQNHEALAVELRKARK